MTYVRNLRFSCDDIDVFMAGSSFVEDQSCAQIDLSEIKHIRLIDGIWCMWTTIASNDNRRLM